MLTDGYRVLGEKIVQGLCRPEKGVATWGEAYCAALPEGVGLRRTSCDDIGAKG